jgi:hypothetical protein
MNLHPPAAHSNRWIALALFLFSTAGLIALYTENNDFPDYYHMDEPRKVRQLERDERDFNHPPLLLDATKAALKVVRNVTKTKADRQRYSVVGRTVSAIFFALAIATTCVAVALRFGWPVGLGMLVFFGADVSIYQFAHYLKEDGTLVLGFGVLLLAMHWFDQTGSRRAAIALGAAIALACSGKYIGALMAPVALGLVAWRLWKPGDRPAPVTPQHLENDRGLRRLGHWLRGKGSTAATLGIIFMVMILCLVLLNQRLLAGLPIFMDSISNEWSGVTVGQKGVVRLDWDKTWYLQLLNVGFPVWFHLSCLFFMALTLLIRRGRAPLPDSFAVLFGLLYLAVISSSPKTADRYNLPTFFAYSYCAAGGFAFAFGHIAARLKHPWNWLPWAAVLLVFVQSALHRWNIPSFGTAAMRNAFERDSYLQMEDWIVKNLDPATTLFLQDKNTRAYMIDTTQTRFRGMQPRIPHQVLTDETLIKAGNLDAARERGVTHVVVAYIWYKRFLVTQVRFATEAAETDFMSQANFYRQMVKEGTCVLEIKPDIMAAHPGLEIWDIRTAEATVP